MESWQICCGWNGRIRLEPKLRSRSDKLVATGKTGSIFCDQYRATTARMEANRMPWGQSPMRPLLRPLITLEILILSIGILAAMIYVYY